MENKKEVLKKINKSVYLVDNCRKNLSKGKVRKVYVVIINKLRIETYYKSKYYAEMYVKKKREYGTYSEDFGKIYYDHYDIYEIFEEEIRELESYELWYEDLCQFQECPWNISSILHFKKFIKDQKLIDYIDESVENIENCRKIRKPVEEMLLESSFKEAKVVSDKTEVVQEERINDCSSDEVSGLSSAETTKNIKKFQLISHELKSNTENLTDREMIILLYEDYTALVKRKEILLNSGASNKLRYELDNKIESIAHEIALIIYNNPELRILAENCLKE